jgi:hypothetical protein
MAYSMKSNATGLCDIELYVYDRFSDTQFYNSGQRLGVFCVYAVIYAFMYSS